eukprot:931050-Prorocentrum_minimum.AAC.8
MRPPVAECARRSPNAPTGRRMRPPVAEFTHRGGCTSRLSTCDCCFVTVDLCLFGSDGTGPTVAGAPRQHPGGQVKGCDPEQHPEPVQGGARTAHRRGAQSRGNKGPTRRRSEMGGCTQHPRYAGDITI